MGLFYADADNGADRRPSRKSTKPTSSSVKHNLEIVYQKRCDVCPLDKAERYLEHPKMEATGSKNPWIYVLGEAPGATEDDEGKQFVGKSGQLLRQHIPRRLLKKIRWNNVIRCRPENNRNPAHLEIEACRKWVEEDIVRTKPRLIILLGKVPIQWALQHDESISNWRGRVVPVRIGSHVCWAIASYHPAYILRLGNAREKHTTDTNKQVSGAELKRLFIRDLKTAWDVVESEYPDPHVVHEDHFDGCGIVIGEGGEKDLERVERFLKKMLKKPKVAIDYETHGLRPYAADAEVLTVAVGTDKDCLAFPLRHPRGWPNKILMRKACQIWKQFLIDCEKKKVTIIAHNAGFEQEWSAVMFGEETILNNTWIDTMAQAYILDERKGMWDLGTLIITRFGFHLKELSSDVDRTRILQSDYKKVLRYNALDSKWTFALEAVQGLEVERRNQTGICQHVSSMARTLVMAQKIGLVLDKDKFKQFSKELAADIQKLQKKLYNLRSVKKFELLRGQRPNLDSPDQIAFILHQILKREEIVDTKKKKGYSVTAKILEELAEKGVPFAKLLLAYRSVHKIKTTYLDSIPKNIYPDGRIHTSYSSMWTSTGRLSSREPNVQNQPKRKYGQIRQIFRAEDNCFIGSLDYGQIEARVIAMASKDREYCKAIWNNFDIHLAWAERAIELYPDIVPRKIDLETDAGKKWKKGLRDSVKNGITFPLFYGASSATVAAALGVPQNIAQQLHDEFWTTYTGVKKWQDRMLKQYNELGYCETLTGRRRQAPMSRQSVFNSPIQGAASDITTYAMNRLAAKGYYITLNIHDDLTFTQIPRDEAEEHLEDIYEEMVNPAPEGDIGDLPWLIVPLAVEIELGVNWGDQDDIGVVTSLDFPRYERILKKRFEAAMAA